MQRVPGAALHPQAISRHSISPTMRAGTVTIALRMLSSVPASRLGGGRHRDSGLNEELE